MEDMDKICYMAFLEGDNSGFESLVTKYKDNLIYFIMRYVEDIYTAEDLAQDAFVEVYIHKKRYNMTTSFKTYLFTIGRNKAVDYIRHHKHIADSYDISETEIRSDEIGLEEKVITDEKNQNLKGAIKSLKPEEQALIDLVYFENIQVKEAGKILKLTESQAKVKLHRARKQLAVILEQAGGI